MSHTLPYTASLFLHQQQGGVSHPFHSLRRPRVLRRVTRLVKNRALARIHDSHPQSSPRLCSGSHRGQLRRQPRKYAQAQKGWQRQGTNRRSLKPCTCFYVTLERPSFFPGSQFCGLRNGAPKPGEVSKFTSFLLLISVVV